MTLDKINEYVKKELKIRKKVISLAFDAYGHIAGFITADGRVFPLFDKTLERFVDFVNKE